MPYYARPFTFTSSTTPQYTESIGGVLGTQLFISAPDNGIFATFGPLSSFKWWNGPDEGIGYVIGTFVDTFDWTTPDGNVGNVNFWRTSDLTEESFINLGNYLLGTSYTTDGSVWNDLSGAADSVYWTSYQYSIFIGGDFTEYYGKSSTRFQVIRKTDGQIDPHVGGRYQYFEPGFSNAVYNIYHRSNGKMLVSGSFTQSFDFATGSYLIQLNSSGINDYLIRAFNGTVYSTIASPHRGFILDTTNNLVDIVAVGEFTQYNNISSVGIVAITTTGAKRALFSNFNDDANCIDADDKAFFVGGLFTTYNSINTNYLAQINKSNGNLATTDIGTVLDSSVLNLKLTDDLQYLWVVGVFSTPFTGIMKWDISSVTYSSGVTTGFANFDDRTRCLDFQSDGSVIIGGDFTSYGASGVNRICKLDSNGYLDSTFQSNIGNGFNSSVFDVKVLHDDRIVAVGSFTDFDGNSVGGIAVLESNGFLSMEWTNAYSSGANGNVYCVAPR